MNEWDLQPRSAVCTSCQKTFEADQPYQTLLAFTADGYQRQDLCATCWPQANRMGEVSYWQGVFQPPPPPPSANDPVKKETAESLLRKLMESTNPADASARYILAVMLERKRILKPRETTQKAGEPRILVYEHAKSGETFVVTDPSLRLDQLEDVQNQIMSLLTTPETVPTPMNSVSTTKTVS